MQPTLYFSKLHSGLLDQLREAFPALEFRHFDENSPIENFDTRTWCFIDWLMPGIAGIEMCRSLRENCATRLAHITLVLEGNDDDLKKRALGVGADDYLIGPLSVEIIAERLSIYGFRSKPRNGKRLLAFGRLEMDMAAYSVRYNGNRIEMSPNELLLLNLFMENPDEALTRQNLITMLGKDCEKIDGRTVDVWIGRLRKALRNQAAPDPIRAVKSVGYVFDSHVLADSTMDAASLAPRAMSGAL